MDEKELDIFSKEIDEAMENDIVKLAFCKTIPGKKFEELFNKLFQYANTEISIRDLMGLFPSIYDVLKDQINQEIQEKCSLYVLAIGNDSIMEFPVTIGTLMEELSLDTIFPFNFDKKNEHFERICAYFILALNAYMEHYCKKIFKKLVRYDKPIFSEVIENNMFIKSPYNKLELIKSTLIENKRGSFHLIKNDETYIYLEALYDVRNIFAHENPISRMKLIETRFGECFEKAKEIITNLFNQTDQDNYEELKKIIRNNLEDHLIILETLIQISKICYKYLTLMDLVIDEYLLVLRKNKE